MPDQPYYGDKYAKPDKGGEPGYKPTKEELQKIRDIINNNKKKAQSPYKGKGPNHA